MNLEYNSKSEILLPYPKEDIFIESFSGKKLIAKIKYQTQVLVDNIDVIDKDSIISILKNAINTVNDEETN